MAKVTGPFRDSLVSSWISGALTDVPAEPPSNMTWSKLHKKCMSQSNRILQPKRRSQTGRRIP